jgi:ppGpp synthetase/RelA/SpoT-type nucleotidyltranferase
MCVPEAEMEAIDAFDFQAHRGKALDGYQRVRNLYVGFTEVVKQIIRVALGAGLRISSVEGRVKELDSFADKAATPDEGNPERPKYPDPLVNITDLAGVRVITFFPGTVKIVEALIEREFTIRERIDKAARLWEEERLGYQSVHYLVELRPNRAILPEYAQYAGLVAEIQVRTVLQHAWAEIEHDVQYKSAESIPDAIKRRFVALAGLLEIADREFQAIQDEDERLRQEARASLQAGELSEVEITGDALKIYLEKRLGPDRRISASNYEGSATALRKIGFQNFEQLDECLRDRDPNRLSRELFGTKHGQLSRFEYLLLAGMGEEYLNRHPWGQEPWWREWRAWVLEKMRENHVATGNYVPPEAMGE